MGDSYPIEFYVLLPGGYIARIPANLHATEEGPHPYAKDGIRYIIASRAEPFLAVMDIHLVIYNSRQYNTDDN